MGQYRYSVELYDQSVFKLNSFFFFFSLPLQETLDLPLAWLLEFLYIHPCFRFVFPSIDDDQVHQILLKLKNYDLKKIIFIKYSRTKVLILTVTFFFVSLPIRVIIIYLV